MPAADVFSEADYCRRHRGACRQAAGPIHANEVVTLTARVNIFDEKAFDEQATPASGRQWRVANCPITIDGRTMRLAPSRRMKSGLTLTLLQRRCYFVEAGYGFHDLRERIIFGGTTGSRVRVHDEHDGG